MPDTGKPKGDRKSDDVGRITKDVVNGGWNLQMSLCFVFLITKSFILTPFEATIDDLKNKTAGIHKVDLILQRHRVDSVQVVHGQRSNQILNHCGKFSVGVP